MRRGMRLVERLLLAVGGLILYAQTSLMYGVNYCIGNFTSLGSKRQVGSELLV